MALLPWQTGKVIRIEDHTYNTKQFWIEIEGIDRFDFVPGQFVTLDLPIHERPNKRWRSYSIASRPDHTNIIELIIVRSADGAGTAYLFEQATVGTTFPVRGPLGLFTLPALEEALFLICTGTGIAPFNSMLRHIQAHGTPHKAIHLIFGCRKKEDLLYYADMQHLQTALPDFHYIPVLSRETWDGRSGYVHPVYEELCAAKQPAHFFICGWRGMIDEARQRIAAMGYDKKAIHFELYG